MEAARFAINIRVKLSPAELRTWNAAAAGSNPATLTNFRATRITESWPSGKASRCYRDETERLRRFDPCTLRHKLIASPSSNGRTSHFECEDRGSNPRGGASLTCPIRCPLPSRSREAPGCGRSSAAEQRPHTAKGGCSNQPAGTIRGALRTSAQGPRRGSRTNRE